MDGGRCGLSKKKKGATAKEKGELVERVVAMMHEHPGVEVRHDVRLPAKFSGQRSRQIDVLVLGFFAGYQTILAIECKNYARNINVADLGGFRDLLEDVGLAPQQGVLISASKIGAGARSRARELGMKVFELKGLTANGLKAAVHEARQRVIFVMPAMSHLAVTDNIGPHAGWEEIGTFFDEEGKLVGLLPDLLWFKWLEGEPASVLGKHDLELEVPEGWNRIVCGRSEPVISISAQVTIHAAVATIPGKATAHGLVDPNTRGLHRYRSNVSFEASPEGYPVRTFSEEGELEVFLKEQPAPFEVIVGRVRTPRIQVNQMYWPPSERLMHRVNELGTSYEAGEIEMPGPEHYKGVEGNDLATLWEPIVGGWPAVAYLTRRENG